MNDIHDVVWPLLLFTARTHPPKQKPCSKQASPFSPPTLVTSNLLSVPRNLPILGISHKLNMSFCVWLISLGSILSWSIHVVTLNITPFQNLLSHCTWVRMRPAYLFRCRRASGCFRLLAAVNTPCARTWWASSCSSPCSQSLWRIPRKFWVIRRNPMCSFLGKPPNLSRAAVSQPRLQWARARLLPSTCHSLRVSQQQQLF